MTDNTVAAPRGSVDLVPEPTPLEFRFDGAWKYFASRSGTPTLAVRDIALDITPSEFVCIIGPSGCGKSTLLNMAAGLMAPTKGRVLHRGEEIRKINSDVSYMTQHNSLIPWRTVTRNVGLPLEIQGVRRAERRRRVSEMLETVGLARFANHYPSQLSGGMQKRAALARTLIYDPATLLMDEPFGALDAQLRLVMQRELLSLWERDRKTVLFITHDVEEALLLADRVIVFSGSPGTVIHAEDIDFERPRDIAGLRSDPRFAAKRELLWQLLEQNENREAQA